MGTHVEPDHPEERTQEYELDLILSYAAELADKGLSLVTDQGEKAWLESLVAQLYTAGDLAAQDASDMDTAASTETDWELRRELREASASAQEQAERCWIEAQKVETRIDELTKEKP